MRGPTSHSRETREVSDARARPRDEDDKMIRKLVMSGSTNVTDNGKSFGADASGAAPDRCK